MVRCQLIKYMIRKFILRKENYVQFRKLKKEIALLKKEKIFLMGTPEYGNLGDQGICIAILHILNEVYPNGNIIEISDSMYDTYKNNIEKIVDERDVIYTVGGGNLGNLYLDIERRRRDIIKRFSMNKIVIMPQSIYFESTAKGKQELNITKNIYNLHKNLHLITRDRKSFLYARRYIGIRNIYLLPDCALNLYDCVKVKKTQREKILFLLRKDKEKVFPKIYFDQCIECLNKRNVCYDLDDTIIDCFVDAKNRYEEVEKKINQIANSKLVITDRFHGLIFSVLTSTPVIVFRSYDTKIAEGIQWFKHLDYVHYMGNNTNGIDHIIDKYICIDKNFPQTEHYVQGLIRVIKYISQR